MIFVGSYETLWADRDGIYQFDSATGSMETLINMRIDGGTMFCGTEKQAPKLLLRSEGKLHLFELVDSTGSEKWFQPDPTHLHRNRPLPKLSARKLLALPELPENFSDFPQIGLCADGKLVAIANYSRERAAFATISLESRDHWTVEEFLLPKPNGQSEIASAAVVSLFPPGCIALALGIAMSFALFSGKPSVVALSEIAPPPEFQVIIFLPILITLLSIGVAFYLCRRRGLSMSTSVAWSAATLLLGIAGPITIAAIYPRLVRELCQRCGKMRRVDRQKCEHCNVEWEPVPSEGIELFDGCISVLNAAST